MRALAVKTVGLVGNVAGAATAALEEMDSVKADKENSVTITIPTSGWQRDSDTYYPFYYDVAFAGITANDGANIAIAVSSLPIASDCGLCPTNETFANKIRVRASSVPAAAITASVWIMRGEEV